MNFSKLTPTLFLAIFLSGSVIGTNVDNCPACPINMANLLNLASSDTSLRNQKDFLKNTYCATVAENYLTCEVGVDTWWDNVIRSIQQKPNITDDLCASASITTCPQQIISCTDCGSLLGEMGNLDNEALLNETITYLMGPGLCEDPIQSPDPEECRNYVAKDVPALLQAVLAETADDSARICSDGLKCADSNCEVCRQATELLIDFAATPEEIETQKTLLKTNVCPTYGNDSVGCETGVDSWWEGIMNSLADWDELPGEICAIINPTCSPTVRAWNCATCKGDIGAVADALKDPTLQTQILDYLDNTGFCVDFTGDDGDACRLWMDDFIPKALPELSTSLKTDANENRYCAALYVGTCDAA